MLLIFVYTIFRSLENLGKGTTMPRHSVPTAVSSSRLLASVIGVAITATSAGHLAYAAETEPTGMY
ncbi:hypothetical protein C6382_05940 [Pseudomonas sp. BBP2017]|nr:hypothetical protein C6382_05940 [Pseudomonas sp. BBP2017]